MNKEQKPSLLIRLLSVTFFCILTSTSLTWFFISVYKLQQQLTTNSPIVTFDKGSMYMLGGGTVGGVLQGIFNIELTEKRESLFKKLMVLNLLLIFILPQLSHYLLNRYINKQHYSIRNKATYHWFLYSKYYYTNNQVTCNQLLK